MPPRTDGDDRPPPRPIEIPPRADAGDPKLVRPFEHAMHRLGLLRWYRAWPTVVLVVCAVPLLLVRYMPSRTGLTPPTGLLVGIGLVLGGVSAALLGAGVRRLGLPLRVAVAGAFGVSCVAVVKFTLGPVGFYDATRQRVFDVPIPGFVSIAVASTGVVTLLLYVAGLRLVYAAFLRRAGVARTRQTVVTVVSGAIVVAGLALAATIVLSVPGLYLRLLLTSIAGGMVAAALVFAIAAFAVAFSTSADAARAAGDVGLYTAVFGISVAFLVAFHVLWIVYVLVLTSVWPLKTVTPK